MKNALRGKQYNNSEEIVSDIIAWFQTKENGFFRKAFDLLPERWQRCVSQNGGYFQHLNDVEELFFSIDTYCNFFVNTFC